MTGEGCVQKTFSTLSSFDKKVLKHEFYLEQHGKCAVCQRQFEDVMSAHLDHCHKTDTVRGLLCMNCNVGLGFFKDNVDLLVRAIAYLNFGR